MSKTAITFVAVLSMMVGSAAAGTLENLKTYVAKNGAQKAYVDILTNEAVIAAVTAADEVAVLKLTLKPGGSYQLLGRVLLCDKLSADGLAVLSDPASFCGNPGGLLTVIRQMPEQPRLSVADRQQLLVPVTKMLNKSMADRPLYVDVVAYWLVNDKYDAEQLLKCLVSTEAATQVEVNLCKTELYNIAVVLAKAALRAEGKTFVVDKNGVNPLAVKLQPVITALNAPCVIGLEAALKDLGLTVPAVDRTQLKAKGSAWKTQLMSGTMAPDKITVLLPALSVALGTEAFNKFVDEYNNAGR